MRVGVTHLRFAGAVAVGDEKEVLSAEEGRNGTDRTDGRDGRHRLAVGRVYERNLGLGRRESRNENH